MIQTSETTYHCLECEFHTGDPDVMNAHIDAEHPDNYGLIEEGDDA